MLSTKRLAQIEQLFFEEGPASFRQAAVCMALIGVAGGLAVMITSQKGFDLRYLWLACIGFVPGVLLWLLSIAVQRRHMLTLPLSAALCGLSLYVFGRNPSAAISGTSLSEVWLVVGWAVVVLEYVLVAAVLVFLGWLWRKGAFARA